MYHMYLTFWSDVILSQLPVRYEVNCLGPQRMAYRTVVLTFL